jgi:hypothetical protein
LSAYTMMKAKFAFLTYLFHTLLSIYRRMHLERDKLFCFYSHLNLEWWFLFRENA